MKEDEELYKCTVMKDWWFHFPKDYKENSFSQDKYVLILAGIRAGGIIDCYSP